MGNVGVVFECQVNHVVKGKSQVPRPNICSVWGSEYNIRSTNKGRFCWYECLLPVSCRRFGQSLVVVVAFQRLHSLSCFETWRKSGNIIQDCNLSIIILTDNYRCGWPNECFDGLLEWSVYSQACYHRPSTSEIYSCTRVGCEESVTGTVNMACISVLSFDLVGNINWNSQSNSSRVFEVTGKATHIPFICNDEAMSVVQNNVYRSIMFFTWLSRHPRGKTFKCHGNR